MSAAYFPGLGMTLPEKVDMAIETFRTFIPADGQPYWGAFSGGKDSCVIKELARLAEVPIEWYYNVTTVDPPELVYFIRQHHKDVKFIYAPKPMWKMAIDKHLPTGKSRWCCEVYKENKTPKDRRLVVGVRAAESKKRAERWRVFMHDKGYCSKVAPILYWTDDDVWTFISGRGLPYCKLYDEGFKRLGCIMCPMARSKIKRDAARWPKIADKWRKTCDIVHHHYINKNAENLKRWPTSDALWEWWTGIKDPDADTPDDECQGLSLFSDNDDNEEVDA